MKTNGDIKLLLADDFLDRRTDLRRQLLSSNSNFSIVAETAVGSEAIASSHQLAPDVILIRLEEPLTRPLRILESLNTVGAAPTVVISSIKAQYALRKAMTAGAWDYLVDPLRTKDLSSTIHSVLSSEQRKKALKSEGLEAKTAQGEVIPVLGAKGGIGKTTIATNLSVALLRETRAKVALLDLNLELGDVAITLDIVPNKDIFDALDIVDRLETELIQDFLYEHSSGLKILPAGTMFGRPESVNDLNIRKIVDLLSKLFDYVVVDTGPRRGGTFPSVFELARHILVVTTTLPPCLNDTRRMLDYLQSVPTGAGKVKVVVNDAYNNDGMLDSRTSILLDHPVFWKIPHDSQLGRCIQTGEICAATKPHAKVSRNFLQLAKILSEKQVE